MYAIWAELCATSSVVPPSKEVLLCAVQHALEQEVEATVHVVRVRLRVHGRQLQMLAFVSAPTRHWALTAICMALLALTRIDAVLSGWTLVRHGDGNELISRRRQLP